MHEWNGDGWKIFVNQKTREWGVEFKEREQKCRVDMSNNSAYTQNILWRTNFMPGRLPEADSSGASN